ncbi:MAG: taurine dioxygenase [Deltaproteobacteria bacterium]|nr:taurine dioxygenase [Deltaproteobacteria bacterium]
MAVYQHITVNPIAGALGAEIGGINLGTINDSEFDEIRAALLEHQVIFFRDQDLTRDQHKAFGRRFGTLHVHQFLQPLKNEGHPEFVVLESDGKHPFVADAWHSDVTFEDNPPLGSVLRCVTAPEFGGDTMWASMYAAYESLSDIMQRFLSGLTAIHDTSRTFSRDNYKTEHIGGKRAETIVAAEHPVIRTHPETGRKALFVNSAFTQSIKDMKPAESSALLNFLYHHIESPDHSCRFRWRMNSLAMWDNRCTQHRVVGDNLTAYRRMERITINGDKPF